MRQKTGRIALLQWMCSPSWLDLVGGVIGAAWIWFKNWDGNSFMTALGFGVLLQGIVCCAFLLVVVSMAANLAAIRKAVESGKDFQ